MNYISKLPRRQAETNTLLSARDELVCWSRMQAEAGQPLERIIARKELERCASNGLFLWGVGNAPARLTRTLARLNYPVRAVFSIMKSRPKAIDVSPSRVCIWRRYIDAHGVERPLPDGALVTSRSDSAGGPKRAHYALMCRSNESLRLERGPARFDPRAYRNAGDRGGPVGASQVTALLRRVEAQEEVPDYEINFEAWLSESYWVRLTDPIALPKSALETLNGDVLTDPADWVRFVRNLRSDRQGANRPAATELLL